MRNARAPIRLRIALTPDRLLALAEALPKPDGPPDRMLRIRALARFGVSSALAVCTFEP